MAPSTTKFKDPRLPFLDPGPNVPGVEMRRADFDSRGQGSTPFQGGRFTLEPGVTSKLDVHDVRECWMVVSGRGCLEYDDREYRVAAGDFCYFEPRKSHRIRNDGAEPLVIYTVWWG